jgi:hypothetical protein
MLRSPGLQGERVPQFGVEYHIQRRAAAWLIPRFIISPMRNRTRESSISSLYPTTRDVNRFSSMLVSILLLLGFAEKSRSVLSGRHAFLGIWDHRHVSSVFSRVNSVGCSATGFSSISAARSLHPQLVSPPNPSMRFVSAHFRAETGRRRESCQLKKLRPASQRLHHHFVAG